jgi:methylmalonyl-CoA/ethylmalonyl-CoA epimerase
MKFHHIGIATKDINKSLEFVKNNFEVEEYTDIIYDKNQNADLMMIKTKDMNIELVSGEVVEKFISKNTTYYHMCYEVDNLEEAINGFQGSIVVSPPKEAILFNYRKVAFLITPLGLIELLEGNNE